MPALVSVVMPVHGDGAFLASALRSVLIQTHTAIEMVVVLDRPSQGARKLVEDFSGKLKDFKVMESSKGGISAALNLGISNCKADFIARLDDDDLMSPNRLAIQLKTLEEKPEIICVGSQVQYIDEDDEKIQRSALPTTAADVRLALQALNCVVHPSTLIRKEPLLAVGGYHEKLDGVEDYHLWLKLLEKGEIENIDQELTFYRRHSNQSSRRDAQLAPWLEGAARLEALELPGSDPTTLWADFFRRVNFKEREETLRRCEKSLELKQRQILKSSRYLSMFFVFRGFFGFRKLVQSLMLSPCQTLRTLKVLLKQRWKTR